MELVRDDKEHPIPVALRPIFKRIADAFANEDYGLQAHAIEGVSLADPETAANIADCVAAYGDPLAGLEDATWQRSCYVNIGDHWEALVDLATANEEVSDLTVHSRIFLDPNLRIIIDSVHVP